MNQVILIGRLVKDPEVKEKYARYTLAVDRKFKKEGEPTADFISLKAFGKNKDFVERWLKKGVKILVIAHVQSGKYEKDGRTIYTQDFLVDSHEFVESKKAASEATADNSATDEFINVVDAIDVDEDLPFV